MACFIVEDGSEPDRVPALRRMGQQLGLNLHPRRSFAEVALDPLFAGPDRPVVLVPDGARPARLAEVLAFAEREGAQAHTLYIADTIDPELYKRLVRTGAAEWTNWDGLPSELAETMRRVAVAAPEGRSARIATFVPSKGGVGTTTLAIETAIHLATRHRRGGARIAIVDLDVQGGTLADMLDVEPRFDFREIGERPDRLDEHLLDILASRHTASQLDVFAGPIRHVDPGGIDPQAVFAFLDALSGRYDVIVIDTPHHGLPWIDTLVQGSDAIVVTGGSTVPALRQLGAALGRIAAPADRVAAAIGPCEADILGRVSGRRDIDKALPEGRRFYIRRDGTAVAAAHDAGRPLADMAARSRVGRDIRSLAEWVEAATREAATGAASGRAATPARAARR